MKLTNSGPSSFRAVWAILATVAVFALLVKTEVVIVPDSLRSWLPALLLGAFVIISKLRKKTPGDRKPPVYFLPGWCRLLGWLILGAVLVLFIVWKFKGIVFPLESPEMFLSGLCFTGMILTILAREKDQDERSLILKTESLAQAFISILFFYCFGALTQGLYESYTLQSLEGAIFFGFAIFWISYSNRKKYPEHE